MANLILRTKAEIAHKRRQRRRQQEQFDRHFYLGRMAGRNAEREALMGKLEMTREHGVTYLAPPPEYPVMLVRAPGDDLHGEAQLSFEAIPMAFAIPGGSVRWWTWRARTADVGSV